MEIQSKRRWGKRIVWIVILAAILVAAFIVIQHRRYLPVINPHPKQFITISGKIDPRLKLSFAAVYETMNNECFINTNFFEGATYPRQRQFVYPASIKDQAYILTLPVDKIKDNFCQWKLNGFFYQIHYKNLISKKFLFAFDQQTKKTQKKYQANVVCKTITVEKKSYLDCAPVLNYNFLLPENITSINVNIKFKE